MSKSKDEAATTSDKAATDQVKVVFTPSGRQGYVPVGTPVLTAARQLGVDIDSQFEFEGVVQEDKSDILVKILRIMKKVQNGLSRMAVERFQGIFWIGTKLTRS